MKTELLYTLRLLFISFLICLMYYQTTNAQSYTHLNHETQLIEKAELKVAPNPVVDIAQLQIIGIPQVQSIQLYNLQGSLVKEWKADRLENGELSMDLSDLHSGVYVLQINEQHAQRVVKL